MTGTCKGLWRSPGCGAAHGAAHEIAHGASHRTPPGLSRGHPWQTIAMVHLMYDAFLMDVQWSDPWIVPWIEL